MKVALASRSPRRRELLEQIGIAYEVINIDIDESWNQMEMPEDYVCRIAIEKARAGKAQLNNDLPVLAADTAVVLDGRILGKAENRNDAIAMLEKLSGKTHEVLSAVTVINSRERTKVNTSKVTFKSLKKEEIEHYCDTEEPIGKAGGYAIQGKAAIFIERLEGSYSGVMGLPLFETQQLLNPK
ncbi:MAG: septum formation inhibitor Maf [Proteobacteria bacterium]|nr:septum formation inhibitor Maf [Pseudomonadota bacterium]NOG60546.1 septum formation inhibitor Maf [Pseudomonadota bacterium]